MMDAPHKTITPKPSLGEHLLMIAVAIVMLVVDQVTKRLIESSIPFGFTVAPVAAISPYLTLTHTQNTGAAFSLLQNGGLFFIIVAVVVSGIIIYYAPRLPAGDWISRLALGLQLSGAIGNLVDRLRQGYVTDFIHFQIPQIGFDWPVFNVADSCIVVGVIILIVASLWRERAADRQNQRESQPVAE
ncbi:MAG: signal peptidase II [Chloroflexi bacterium]|nr:signal peptidase II [Chloroflexota bacterium]